MATDLTYTHIEESPDSPARLARLPRIRVAQIVMDYLAHGWSPDEMCRQHPDMIPAEAHAAMMYYYDHRERIDDEILAELELSARSRAAAPPTSLVLKLRATGLL